MKTKCKCGKKVTVDRAGVIGIHFMPHTGKASEPAKKCPESGKRL